MSYTNSPSYLHFRTYGERDACEVAVKDAAAQNKLVCGVFLCIDDQIIKRCPLGVMEKVLDRNREDLMVDGKFTRAFTTPYDRSDARDASSVRPAGPKATAFALQQIRDAKIG